MSETLQEIGRYIYDENQKFKKSYGEELENRFAEFMKATKSLRTGYSVESPAARFVSSPEFKNYLASARQSDYPAFSYKVVGSITLGHVPNSLAPPVQVGPAMMAMYPSNIRQLIPSREVASEYIIGVRESGSEGDAGIQVNEGDTKAQIDLKFVPASFELHQFAGWTKVSTQCLEDVGWMQGVIETNLTRKIQAAEEKQFVADLLAAATAWTGGVAGVDNAIDQIARAQNSLEVLGWTISGTLVNPADLGTIRRLKTTTGEYLSTPPWIGPVMASKEIPAGQFLTGAFRDASVILDRDSTIKILLGMMNDDFVKNLRVVLAEQRSYLWIGQPTAFAKGSLTAPAGLGAEATESRKK